MLTKPKNRKLAVTLALLGVALPISGIHKFYMGQPKWGVAYLLLSLFTPIPRFACAAEAAWYLFQNQSDFEKRFAAGEATIEAAKAVDPAKVGAVAEALRQLDQLRQDGLLSEYEFEQKRRQLLDRIA